ncbi:MAG: aldehyde dehydrogenase family protein, partial [Planctomycetes bacterium]|nr:aldehyde dehydrogenase family protein [Planctomycetota bacterium]
MKTINPATGEPLREYQFAADGEIEEKLQAAEKAFRQWREVSVGRRVERMRAAANVLRDRAPEFARLMTEEMGKPIGEAGSEIEKCAWVCDYYAEHGEEFLGHRTVETDASRSYVRYDPIGPVLAIMPWNFPFWQVFRFAAPALTAGNVGVLKHASNVPGCAVAIEEVFREAGFPAGALAALLVETEKIEGVIAHPVIRAVTLTGSERAGRAVGQQAGGNLKKTVLELGGSDPFIVLADVNAAEVAQRAVKGRTINSGQSCIAAKRFLVEEPIADEFLEAFLAATKKLKIGDPL